MDSEAPRGLICMNLRPLPSGQQLSQHLTAVFPFMPTGTPTTPASKPASELDQVKAERDRYRKALENVSVAGMLGVAKTIAREALEKK